ncbi:MAG: L-seryl-tRNA(Sec) selenium transferase [Myxococcales bacterium]|nr:L-seryl-tRNA(Sec) selenium transferase [Myxococcales bacterium]
MQLPADRNAVLRRLPKVDEVLASPALSGLLERAPRWAVLTAVRGEIERLRAEIVAERLTTTAERIEVDAAQVAVEVAALLQPSLQPVLNATGVVLHTNLGRAPLAAAAVARVVEVARGYANLEYRLDERRRGSRHEHVARLLATLTGAEDALVVNNCAAAVLLALSQLAAGRGVVVSRGELVEIGGSFRVPDVMRASGARLVEVGTTNRTHARDYEAAVADDTALLLKVHRSNFAVVGFTAEVSVGEMAEIAHRKGLYAMVDLGSGALADLRALGLGDSEPTVPQIVAAGADVVTFSGDKLLGGPQAGIIVGQRAAIAAMRAHPLLRAVRPDKMTLAALEATLELYRDGRAAEIPALAMLSTPEPTLEARARTLSGACQEASAALAFTPVRVRSAVGGGALPTVEPWSWAVAVSAREPAAAGAPSAEALDARLRRALTPVVARIAEDRLLLDVRTLGDDDLPAVVRAFAETLT